MYRAVIVDDERIERNGIRFLLGQTGIDFEIVEFPNGQAAYEWFLSNQADLLLTDIKMPFMDGLELIAKIAPAEPQMAVVIFSGFSEFEYAKTAMRYHVENYILKPVDPSEFEETIGQIIKKLENQRAEAKKQKEKQRQDEEWQKIMKHLDEKIGSKKWESGQGHREIETVKKYIYQNYGSELSIELLADQVYMAPAYLSTLFKRETGQNLSKFIKAVRMEAAKWLLETSHRKIIDIGQAVGYANVSYFCQSFREYFGVSPQKFRSKGEENEEALEESE